MRWAEREVVGRTSVALLLDTLDPNTLETSRRQIGLDSGRLIVSVWRPGEKERGVLRIQLDQRFRGDMGEIVLFERAPTIEDEAPARPKNPEDLGKTLDVVREEHHAELAQDDVETFVLEGQRHHVRLPPFERVFRLLVVRELMFGAKRFSDLKADLRTITPNVLTQRLEDLCAAGIVARRRLPAPAASWVYELTPWGRDLEPVLRELGRWAAQSPSLPQGRPISAASVILAMRTMFDAVRADRASFELSIILDGVPYEAEVQDGTLEIEISATPARLGTIIETCPQTLDALLFEDADLEKAIVDGRLTLSGDRGTLQRFLDCFTLPA